MELDPGFIEFFSYCDANDIPFIIVSRYAHSTLLIRKYDPSLM